MTLKKSLYACLLFAVFLGGCKKDDDEEVTYLYLDGKITLSMPQYVTLGQEFTFVIDSISTLSASGIKEDERIGYFFTDPYTGLNDTLATGQGSYKFVVLDTLGSFSLTVKGFLSGYVNSSSTAEFTVVDPSLENGSITGHGIEAGDPFITDERDGRKYYYTAAGNLLWTRNNLAYEGSGRAYKDVESMSDLFGRYYTFEEALTACPEGWRLPSAEEFDAMCGTYGGRAGVLMAYTEFNGERMWEHWSSVKVTNESRLAIMPTGYATVASNSYTFQGLNEYAALWTSSSEGDMGIYKYIYQDKDVVFNALQAKDGFALPVRCVKENNQ